MTTNAKSLLLRKDWKARLFSAAHQTLSKFKLSAFDVIIKMVYGRMFLLRSNTRVNIRTVTMCSDHIFKWLSFLPIFPTIFLSSCLLCLIQTKTFELHSIGWHRASAEHRARVLIPPRDYKVHPLIVTEHSGIKSRPNSMSSTLDGFVSYAHMLNLNEWRLVISNLTNWLRHEICISIMTTAI